MTTTSGSSAADNEPVQSAADMLVEARQTGMPLASLDPYAPTDVAQSYAIADRVAELLEDATVGWKIGCTSEFAQKVLGSNGPISGRVHTVHQSGATLTAADHPNAQLEGEFAFRLKEDLPARTEPWTPDEVREAVKSMHPAIEVVGGRTREFLKAPILTICADSGGNSCLVLGHEVDNWEELDLAATTGQMSVGGAVTGSGSGADVLGHPLEALAWLATHLAQRGIGLSAGQVITTGTCTQVTPAVAGATATATFTAPAGNALGSVHLSFK